VVHKKGHAEMTTKILCDRCGKECNVQAEDGAPPDWENVWDTDLCRNCVEDLSKFLRTPPPRAAQQ
jgi:hypothetical protein